VPDCLLLGLNAHIFVLDQLLVDFQKADGVVVALHDETVAQLHTDFVTEFVFFGVVVQIGDLRYLVAHHLLVDLGILVYVVSAGVVASPHFPAVYAVQVIAVENVYDSIRVSNVQELLGVESHAVRLYLLFL